MGYENPAFLFKFVNNESKQYQRKKSIGKDHASPLSRFMTVHRAAHMQCNNTVASLTKQQQRPSRS